MAKTEITTVGYNNPEYDIFYQKWQLCRDVMAGGDRIKSLDDKYLPKSRWHKDGGKLGKKDYEAYKMRAIFYSYFREAILTMLGVLGKNEPVVELPKNLEFFKDSATPYKDGLVALNSRLNRTILNVGNAGLSLEVNGDSNKNDVPDFYINMWQPETIKDKVFISDSGTGETYIKFVLLSESDWVFNYTSKQREFIEKWRIMALDANGDYYTAQISPEQWADFNIDNPPVAGNQNNPGPGEAVYPLYRGSKSTRVPFTFVNSTDLSGGHYEDPPLYDLANLVLALYRGEADYRQTLHFTASDFYQMTGCRNKDDANGILIGAGCLAVMTGEQKIEVVSTNGGGARLQKESLDVLHELCQRKILTLLDVGANQSGLALQMIQGSKSALIEPINQNTGNAIEEQLRYAAIWGGISREEAFASVKYTPAKIESTALETAALISLWSARKTLQLPITKETFHNLLRKAGITDADFETYMAEFEAEIATEQEAAINQGGYLNVNDREPGENGKETRNRP